MSFISLPKQGEEEDLSSTSVFSMKRAGVQTLNQFN
jgi:hypothetical protein